jgi:uncharacterized protein YcaQ
LVESYSKEIAKEFVIRRSRLTPDTNGKDKDDVLSIISSIGGLQYGGHLLELFSRFKKFKTDWFNYWYETHALVEGHVLRGALRIVNSEEYIYYFKATRSVARRRKYHNCPLALSKIHFIALAFINKKGPFTPSEFRKNFSHKLPQYRDSAYRLIYDLYNYGKVARIGRKNNKPLFHSIEKLPYELSMSRIREKEAKKWLLTKCLSIYGPFTLKDIAHWVGWTITETKEVLNSLLKERQITNVKIEGDNQIHYVRNEDVQFLNSLVNNLPDYSFIRILFNDDSLLLGYYKRLKDYFGYDWIYPQFSAGVVWRAAILLGRNLVGEAIIDMHANSKFLEVKKLILRKEFISPKTLLAVKDESNRVAMFQGKILKWAIRN